MAKLGLCPYCGGKAELSETTFYQKQYFVVCSNGCRIHTPFFPSAEDAANRWNSRPLESALQARIAELEAKLNDYNVHGYS